MPNKPQSLTRVTTAFDQSSAVKLRYFKAYTYLAFLLVSKSHGFFLVLQPFKPTAGSLLRVVRAETGLLTLRLPWTDIYTFNDLLFSLQSIYNSELHSYEFLAYFSNVSIIYSCYKVSFYMPCKILNLG